MRHFLAKTVLVDEQEALAGVTLEAQPTKKASHHERQKREEDCVDGKRDDRPTRNIVAASTVEIRGGKGDAEDPSETTACVFDRDREGRGSMALTRLPARRTKWLV